MAATGQVLLVVGAIAAVLAGPVALLGRPRSGAALLTAAAAALATATGLLVRALVGNDFSLVYVADASRRSMPAPYRAAALWGGMEGSLLFWTALLAIVVATLAIRARRSPAGALAPLTVAVCGSITAAFAAVTLLTANPFRVLQIPAVDGGGIVPILEHPAMLYHPPLLYLGLVSLVPPFAVTVDALATRRLDDAWYKRMHVLLLVPWTLLAVGMVAGANWAYVELGWGGYWAWDPIENTALLPWLALTAAMHQRLRSRHLGVEPPDPRDGDLVLALLVLVAFVMAMVGTLLTRSGAASSVHAFAQATATGRALLGLTVIVFVASAAVWLRAWRGYGDHGDGDRLRAGVDRSRLLGVHVIVVTGALVLILAGTMTPVVRSLLGGDVTAIDGSYFATMTAPLVWVVLVLMAVTPSLSGGTSPREIEQVLRIPTLAGLAVATGMAAMGWTDIVTLVTAVLAGMAATAAVRDGLRARRATSPERRRVGALASPVAHLGFAVLLLGIAGSTAGRSDIVLIATGQTLTVGGLEVHNDGVRVMDRADPQIVAAIDVRRRGADRLLEPSITAYPTMGQRLAETALWSDPTGDVQIVLRTADDSGNALIEIHQRPLAPLVWWGGVLVVAGAALALMGTRSGASAMIERTCEARTGP